jgi:hypothetical protein
VEGMKILKVAVKHVCRKKLTINNDTRETLYGAEPSYRGKSKQEVIGVMTLIQVSKNYLIDQKIFSG